MIIQYNFPALIFTRNTVKFPQETNANVAGMTSRGNQQYDQLLAKTPSRKPQHSNNISMNHFHLPLNLVLNIRSTKSHTIAENLTANARQNTPPCPFTFFYNNYLRLPVNDINRFAYIQ